MGAVEGKIIRMKDFQTPTGPLPVAWLEVAGRKEVAVPLIRLAEAVGLHPNPFRSLVQRDLVLQEFQTTITVVSGGLKRTQTFLLRPGVLGALVKISTRRIQDPAKRERIVQFQRWAFKTLDLILFEGEEALPRPQPLFPEAGRAAPAYMPTRGDRALATRMLVGEIRRPGGHLYSYSEISRLTGVARTTLRRLAKRLGVAHLRWPYTPPAQGDDRELLNLLLAQQVQVLQRMLKSMAR